MKNIIDISNFNELAELAKDLTLPMSLSGKKTIIERLNACAEAHRAELANMMKLIDSLSAKCSSLEDRLVKPNKLEKEFIDTAKKLNFPINEAISTPGGAANPNIEMPFEDPVPKKDIDFIKNYLAENKEVDVEIPKEEQLSDVEIKAYTCEKGISQLASNELSTLKSLNNIDGLLKNKVEKRKIEKSKRKKEKTKKDDGKKPTEVNK